LPLCQLPLLLAASFGIYAYEQPYLLLLLVILALVAAATSYAVMASAPPRAEQGWAFVGVTINLVILGFFKYGGLIEDSLFGTDCSADDVLGRLLASPLPVGISSYTFHGIRLILDVSRSAEAAATKATRHRRRRTRGDTCRISARSGTLERYFCASRIATRRRPSRRRTAICLGRSAGIPRPSRPDHQTSGQLSSKSFDKGASRHGYFAEINARRE
jgi:hypothetical protein